MFKKRFFPIKKEFNIAGINKILLIVFLLLIMCTIYDLGASFIPQLIKMNSDGSGQMLFLENMRQAKTKSAKEIPADAPSLSYYTSMIDSRELFKSSINEGGDASTKAGSTAAPARLEEIAKSLILKGIVAGKAPQAIIEDSKTGRTYFVITKDRINGLTVEQITDNKVKLKLNDQSIDLTF